jgi:hypothetical protein
MTTNRFSRWRRPLWHDVRAVFCGPCRTLVAVSAVRDDRAATERRHASQARLACGHYADHYGETIAEPIA